MKTFFLMICLFATFTVCSQRNFTFGTIANLNLAATGFGTNDAGIGIALYANAFAKNRVTLRTEASLDHFIGSKLGYLDATGNVTGYNPTVLSVKAGPEFFINSGVSVSGLFGVATFQKIDERTTVGEIKLALTAYVGKKRKGLISFPYTTLPPAQSVVHFVGLHLGYKVF